MRSDVTFSINVNRLVDADTFHFAEPGSPCPYWSTGDHIIAVGGCCRCGKTFLLYEKDPYAQQR